MSAAIDTFNRAYRVKPLPMGAIGTSASGWWGACFLLISETSLFAYLFFSYFYFSIQPPANWVPGGPPSFFYPGIQTGIVLVGCATVWFANRSIQLGQWLFALLGLAATWLLCSGFIAVQFLDWFDKPFTFALDTYSSEYFLITGAHLAHVVLGWIILLMVLIWTALGYFDPVRYVPVTITALYWYFVAAIWIGVFFTLTCTPYFF
ncbi:MAG TPA: cytochrome c oxidase subunit 3 [Xanthobacteraceae bacterium]|jgi:heme/copper-type cytochrome/quinol oxidase subunit 3